ncbi:hypothetical protein PHYBLDRAFT_70817 [Phycomyces blakesleeanus NRRL 1555(-)]|uniref:Uncharacterized protein n=2 Tax=Phycomyces blakesleeanus TaxID=4837 RepID=A0A162TVW7_PHYB8|nr:hypothetical protein PHYBLDRAFT_70817 [Phycomyces blakesleeanus NRRL 1555(-)]OAD71402.1 hypothetical protein PHYBLDRAFT_70817 [Phycomyces blakesleeanus NRRL 1555(-)]|eukprot:XP_018289442.1 hypothetical protein PHYBLDRAFT_70817 [Phycomyces blakesleeanus NRRL 1555(-)]
MISMVLGLVCAAPLSSDDKENCVVLTHPTNGTVWYASGSYLVSWNLRKHCYGTYYTYMIPATEQENGEYAFGVPYKSPEPVDINSGMGTIDLADHVTPGSYAFAVAKYDGEGMDYNDFALVNLAYI